MQDSWVQPSRHDECMDNKIYSESFIETILPTKYLYGRNQCQVQLRAFFFTSAKLGYEMYLNQLRS